MGSGNGLGRETGACLINYLKMLGQNRFIIIIIIVISSIRSVIVYVHGMWAVTLAVSCKFV